MTDPWIADGDVTSPLGFRAGGSYASIKTYGPEPRRDVGLLVSDVPCVATGLFTKNRVCGAPVTVSKENLANHCAQAIAVNSGCSNVAMGHTGLQDARTMASHAADQLGLDPTDILVASTGVIGRPLPMEALKRGLNAIEPSREGGLDFARAMMTTDRVPKRRALRIETPERTYTLGGSAKGSGMARPDMATVLCFLTTDAPLSPSWAQRTLAEVADVSLNMLNIDLDTSTSDSLLWLANGAAGGTPIDESHPASGRLRDACLQLCQQLTRDLARDGEGARTLIEVVVQGAKSSTQARDAAHTIVSSPLVKTMVTGRDPNIGRVLMAVGRSGAEFQLENLDLTVNGVSGYTEGAYSARNEEALRAGMDAEEVKIVLNLNEGSHTATAWGCDLTEEYVRINADYTT